MCMKPLYLGDTLAEAAHRAGVDSTTFGRWIDRWNTRESMDWGPSFGGGKSPKLTVQQQKRLKRVLAEYQPWTTTDVRLLVEDAFDVSYSERHSSRLLRRLGMNYSILRPADPNQSDDVDEILDEHLQKARVELTDGDNKLVTGDRIVVGFLVEAWPQPTDNRRRLCVRHTDDSERNTDREL